MNTLTEITQQLSKEIQDKEDRRARSQNDKIKFDYALTKILEDIWNYRAELTSEKKNIIVPNKTMFEKSVKTIYSIYSKTIIQNIILDEIDSLISSAINDNDKITGSYFVLTALVEVSPECSQSLPWLIQ